MQARLRYLAYPLAFLLPVLGVTLGAHSDRHQITTTAALTRVHEPSAEIEAALEAERSRQISQDFADAAAAQQVIDAQAAAEVQAAVDAQAAQEAADAAQAETDAANKRQAARQAQARQAATPTPAAPTTPHKVAAASYGSGACGGSLPPCYVMERESGGNLTIPNSEGSGATGKWQFMPGTWGGYGGYASAADAPESVQDAKAADTWNGGSGCSHWNAC